MSSTIWKEVKIGLIIVTIVVAIALLLFSVAGAVTAFILLSQNNNNNKISVDVTNDVIVNAAFANFTPSNITLSTGSYDVNHSYFFYRVIADFIEIELQMTLLAQNAAAKFFSIRININPLPYNLKTTNFVYGVGYGSIVAEALPPNQIFGFIGVEGFSYDEKTIYYFIYFDNSNNATVQTYYFNARFVGQLLQ